MRARLAIAASGVAVELREVLLRDKAPELLTASPKATVPVVVDGGHVIEESFEIMHWALGQNDPEGWLGRCDRDLIATCDGPFKTALDAYKYTRSETHAARDAAAEFVQNLDNILASQPYLSGEMIGMTDMSIVTFVRQFANVDRAWFDAEPWPNALNWLTDFLESDRFGNMMQKYPKWQAGDAPIFFPENP